MSKPPLARTNLSQVTQGTLPNAINSMNDSAHGIIMTLLGVETATREDLQTGVAELLSPEMMFNKETNSYLILSAEIRKFLKDHRVQLRVNKRYCAFNILAKAIDINGDDILIAIELTKRIIEGSIYHESTNVSYTTYAYESASDRQNT